MVFDFCGSGLSQGEYVTLGINERQDLLLLVRYLRSHYSINQIALYGRSMGAVTSMLFTETHPHQVTLQVLDTPFTDLETLVKDYTHQHSNLPNIMIKVGFSLIRNKINKLTRVDISSIDSTKAASNSIVPAIFIAGENDSLVPKSRVL